MKRIYTIILLFVLVFSQINAQSGSTGGIKGISLTGSGTTNGHTFAIGSKATKSAVISAITKSSAVVTNDTITVVGFFKDRDCVGAVTLPLTRSCGIGCATGAGNMAGCWKSGLGVFIYDASQSGAITKDSARSDAHFLLFDAQSKELTRAFVESLPSAASGKISIKVTGYWSADSITSNKIETLVPELITDSIDHKLRAFHLLSIEGVNISGLTYSYAGFASTSYKSIPEDLAPTNVSALNFTGGTTVKFTPPANARKTSSNLSGYKVRVYNSAGELQSSYTTITNDTTVTSVNISGLTASSSYYITVTALYSSSAVEVESAQSNVVESNLGIKNATISRISVYPTLSQGEITIISPAEATVKVFDYTGKTIETYQSSGSRTISLNVPSGLYLVKVESAGETSVQKVIIRK